MSTARLEGDRAALGCLHQIVTLAAGIPRSAHPRTSPTRYAGPVGPARPETVALWVARMQSMRPDELDDSEPRTFAAWDTASLGDLRRAIERRNELTG